MKSIPAFRVVVQYPADKYPKYDGIFETLAGAERDGSGYGMGVRDMDWWVDTKKKADSLAKKFKKTKRPGVKVSIERVEND